jgi:hypothetical protein
LIASFVFYSIFRKLGSASYINSFVMCNVLLLIDLFSFLIIISHSLLIWHDDVGNSLTSLTRDISCSHQCPNSSNAELGMVRRYPIPTSSSSHHNKEQHTLPLHSLPPPTEPMRKKEYL